MEENCKQCGRTYASLLGLMIRQHPFCPTCLRKAGEPLHELVIDVGKVTYIHEYSLETMGQLVSLKGNGEKVYKDILIPPTTRKILKKKYHDATFVYMPSSKDADEERGFRHLEVLFAGIAKEECYPLYKKVNYKQAKLSLEERQDVAQRLGVYQKEVERLKGKRVVLVDDVMTSGATLKGAKTLLGLSKCEMLICLHRPLEVSNYDERIELN